MSIENEYIAKGEDKKEKETSKKPRKKKASAVKQVSSGTQKKKKNTKKKDAALTLLLDRFDKKKVKSTIGVLFILLSFYILLSCFSYLLTWEDDQNRVMGKGFFEFLFDGNAEPVANWLGKFGAWISHVLIYNWFGVSSFAFALILFVSGFKALFNISVLPLAKTMTASVLSIVWISLFLGFFSSQVNFLGGTFGYQINDWLSVTLGRFGAFILIIAIGYISSLILFN
ncbi:MAG: DNA translocase FtsK 4TM domain-containing protein, partial [Crocinitomicaceae bacterium]|nr:DNA translocase FtsK 4TM domain-containing protein [Crocinitomicaceae bacterium]